MGLSIKKKSTLKKPCSMKKSWRGGGGLAFMGGRGRVTVAARAGGLWAPPQLLGQGLKCSSAPLPGAGRW